MFSATLRIFKRSFGINKTSHRRRRNYRYPRQEIPDDDQPEDNDDQLRISVYKYTRPVKRGRRDKFTRVDSADVDGHYTGWVKLNIQPALLYWSRHPRRNHGLLVRVYGASDEPINAFSVFEWLNCSEIKNKNVTIPLPFPLPDDVTADLNNTLAFHNNTYPILDIRSVETATVEKLNNFQPEDDVTDEDLISRRRRSSETKDKTCIKEPIYVSFAEFGWSDWIIAPQGFWTGYCSGTCTQIVNPFILEGEGLNKGKILQYKCCGPNQLKPISFLYMDANNKVALSMMDDFIVGNCGCSP